MQERNPQLNTGAFALGEILAGAYRRGANKERVEGVQAALEMAVSAVIPFTAETADLYGRIRGTLEIASVDAFISLALPPRAPTFFSRTTRTSQAA